MMCVLLVTENHEQFENLERGLMITPGTSIMKAVSADRAISLIRKNPVDLAIVDETVSGISAKQLIELMIMVNPAINTAMIQGKTIVEVNRNDTTCQTVKHIWEKISLLYHANDRQHGNKINNIKPHQTKELKP